MRMLHGTEELHSASGCGHKSALKWNMSDSKLCFCRSYSLGNLMCTQFKFIILKMMSDKGLRLSKLFE